MDKNIGRWCPRDTPQMRGSGQQTQVAWQWGNVTSRERWWACKSEGDEGGYCKQRGMRQGREAGVSELGGQVRAKRGSEQWRTHVLCWGAQTTCQYPTDIFRQECVIPDFLFLQSKHRATIRRMRWRRRELTTERSVVGQWCPREPSTSWAVTSNTAGSVLLCSPVWQPPATCGSPTRDIQLVRLGSWISIFNFN